MSPFIPDPDVITRLRDPSRNETEPVRGSRFICDLSPVESESAAAEYVALVRAGEPSATHHCWAYRIEPNVERSSDDGEPSGTAGAPILRRLRAVGLWNTVAVVTRYYGGTNLGTGGLIRAYGAAVGEAIERATVEVFTPRTRLILVHSYEQSDAIARALAAHDASIDEATYAGVVTLTVSVPRPQAEAFIAEVVDASSGLVTPKQI